MRASVVVGTLAWVAVACAGACSSSSSSSTSTTPGDGGASSGSSGSSGASGSSSGGDAGRCPGFHVGGTNDASIGGSASSQVTAQAAADLAGDAATQIAAMTTACKDIATSLGASASNQAAADGQTDANKKEQAWCALAVASIKATVSAGVTLSVQITPSPCREAVATKAACQGRCAGGPPCTMPMTCSGGTLSGGFCIGGTLKGGCAVDAKCDASCDTTVAVDADCAAPSVTVTVSGSNAAAAAKLKSALEANLPAIFGTKDKCDLEANSAGSFTGNVSAVNDLAPECLVVVVEAATNGVGGVTVCVQSTADVAAAVGQ